MSSAPGAIRPWGPSAPRARCPGGDGSPRARAGPPWLGRPGPRSLQAEGAPAVRSSGSAYPPKPLGCLHEVTVGVKIPVSTWPPAVRRLQRRPAPADKGAVSCIENTELPQGATQSLQSQPLSIVTMTIVGSAGPTSYQPGALPAESDLPSLSDLSSPDPRPRHRPRPWWQRPGRPAWSVPARTGIFGSAAFLYTWDLARVGRATRSTPLQCRAGPRVGGPSSSARSTRARSSRSTSLRRRSGSMELSGRTFGFSTGACCSPRPWRAWPRSWCSTTSCGAGTTSLPRSWGRWRWRSHPVAVVVFRDNNPDASLDPPPRAGRLGRVAGHGDRQDHRARAVGRTRSVSRS